MNSLSFHRPFPSTIILRHRKENLKKCSLAGLESRQDMQFIEYPFLTLPDLSSYFLLSLDGDPLSDNDQARGIFLIDATWNYAEVMQNRVLSCVPNLVKRSIPSHFKTVYPRKQTGCPDPERGLASIEALYIAYQILGRNLEGLLDRYYWKNEFLTQDRFN